MTSPILLIQAKNVKPDKTNVRGFESSSQPPGAAACTSPQTGTFLYPVPKRDGMQANPPHCRYSAFAPSRAAFLYPVRGFESISHYKTSGPLFAGRRLFHSRRTFLSYCPAYSPMVSSAESASFRKPLSVLIRFFALNSERRLTRSFIVAGRRASSNWALVDPRAASSSPGL